MRASFFTDSETLVATSRKTLQMVIHASVFVQVNSLRFRFLHRALLILTGAALTTLPAFSQPVQLSGLLDLALVRHPAILQARSQLKVSGFDLDAAQWGRYPSVSSELRSDTAYTQSIARVEQPLWSGGRIESRIELGAANVEVAKAGLRDAELNVLTQVGGGFFEILRLTERLLTAQDSVIEHQRLFEMISRRVQSEISPPADATLAQARLQQALSEQLQIQRQLDAAKHALIQWAGPLSGELVAPQRIDFQHDKSAAFVVEQARFYSGVRQKYLAQIDSAQAQIQLAQAQGMPTVVAGYQHIVAGPLYSGMDRGRSYIGVQIQPGAGLSALSGIQSAVSKREAAEQDLQVFDRNLEALVKTLYSDIDALQSQLAPAQALQQGTAELVDSYLRQYQIGRKNWLDVLNAVREKSQALYNLADVRNGLQQSQVKLLILTGDIQGQQSQRIHE